MPRTTVGAAAYGLEELENHKEPGDCAPGAVNCFYRTATSEWQPNLLLYQTTTK
jgi:hypothetical protein